ncbi:MAG: hypothetical protein IKI58_04735 [Oscillospiraceae bacterium]|nr:hypothetical protein [Oscillospiraceae bacterium]
MTKVYTGINGSDGYQEVYRFNENNQLTYYSCIRRGSQSITPLEETNYQYDDAGKLVSAEHDFRPVYDPENQKFFMDRIVRVQGVYKHSYPGFFNSNCTVKSFMTDEKNPPVKATDEFNENGIKTQTIVTFLNGATQKYTYDLQYRATGGWISEPGKNAHQTRTDELSISLINEEGKLYLVNESYQYDYGLRLKSKSIYGKTETYYYHDDGTLYYRAPVITADWENFVSTYQYDENGNVTNEEIRRKRDASSA